MLYPEPMVKLFALAPKSSLPKVVEALHRLKIAHFVDHQKDEYDLCQPLASFDRISNLLVQARSLKSLLDLRIGGRKSSFSFDEIEADLNRIKKDLSEILDQKKRAEDSLHLLNSQEPVLRILQSLGASPEDFFVSRHICFFFGFIGAMPSFDEQDILIRSALIEKKHHLAIFADIRKKQSLEKLLEQEQFVSIDLAAVKGLSGEPGDLLASFERKKEDCAKEINKANSKLATLVRRNGQELADMEHFLSKESEKGQAPLSFGSTKETFFLRCFVPKSKKDDVMVHMRDATDNKIHVIEEEISDEEDVPIKLDNDPYAGNFEFFTKLYALPKYQEFDPTKLMAYTFPLFFGFMLGDVIYGLITLLLFYYLARKFPDGKKFFNIMMVASISAMVFGVMYGEWFGFEPYHGLIVRTHDFNALMLIAIVAGVIQINLGLLLGFILEYKHHGLMHALTHKASWVLLQIGGALFFGPLLGMLTLPKGLFYLGIGIFTVAAAMLYKAEGFIGIMEMPSILSHIVSYARLMAVGLASVFVAVIINESATHLFHEGIVWWPLALLILVVGHTFNIALGILSPTLHAVRLHYVEFFTKFYQGGGVEYTPFGAEKEKSIL